MVPQHCLQAALAEREEDEEQHRRTSLLVKVKQQLFVNVPKLLLNDTEDKEEIKKELGPKGIINKNN
jgi:hypothetical protein